MKQVESSLLLISLLPSSHYNKFLFLAFHINTAHGERLERKIILREKGIYKWQEVTVNLGITN
jgi:hypothetical protein